MVSPDLERLRQQVLAQSVGVAGPARINATLPPVQVQQSPSHVWPAFVYRLWYRLELLIKAWQWLQSTAAEPYSPAGRLAAWAEKHTWAYWKLRIFLGAVLGAGYGVYLWLTASGINGEVHKMIGAMAAGGLAISLMGPAIFFQGAAFYARWWRWFLPPILLALIVGFIRRVILGLD